jgi:hypothetical protein
MKYQTNKELGPFFNAWGCNIDAHLEKIEKVSKWNYSWSNEGILNVYHESMDKGFVQKEKYDCTGDLLDGCTVLNGIGLFNLAADYAGLNYRCVAYKVETPDYVCKHGEEEILKCQYTAKDENKTVHTHFMDGLGSNLNPWNKDIEFDPIEGGSNTAKYGHIVEKHILTIVEYHPDTLLKAEIPRPREVTEAQHTYLLTHPACAVCGGVDHAQAHHIIDYGACSAIDRVDIAKDQRDFITLCEKPGSNHHLEVGHLGVFTSINLDVIQDSARWRGLEIEQIINDTYFQEKKAKRPKPVSQWTEEDKNTMRSVVKKMFPKGV